MISLIILLVVLGLVLWALKFLPIPEPFITIIKVVFILVAVIALLNALGVHTGVPLSLN